MKRLKLSVQILIVTEMESKQIGNRKMVKLYQERCGRVLNRSSIKRIWQRREQKLQQSKLFN
jgi:hypothetical protein